MLQFLDTPEGLPRHAATGVLKAERRIVLHEWCKGLHDRLESCEPATMLRIRADLPSFPGALASDTMTLAGLLKITPGDLGAPDGHEIARKRIEQDLREPVTWIKRVGHRSWGMVGIHVISGHSAECPAK